MYIVQFYERDGRCAGQGCN